MSVMPRNKRWVMIQQDEISIGRKVEWTIVCVYTIVLLVLKLSVYIIFRPFIP